LHIGRSENGFFLNNRRKGAYPPENSTQENPHLPPMLLEQVVLQHFTQPSILDQLSATFLVRFLINLATMFVLIRGIYFTTYKTQDLFFTFFIFNQVIFLISFALNGAELSLGAAFGLFAVFSMLRYKTEDISIKNMTYLFLSISIGVLTAVATGGWELLLAISGILLLSTYLLESKILLKKEVSKNINIQGLSLIGPEHSEALILDLKTKTGLNIHRVQIEKLDFVKETAYLKIFYYEE